MRREKGEERREKTDDNGLLGSKTALSIPRDLMITWHAATEKP